MAICHIDDLNAVSVRPRAVLTEATPRPSRQRDRSEGVVRRIPFLGSGLVDRYLARPPPTPTPRASLDGPDTGDSRAGQGNRHDLTRLSDDGGTGGRAIKGTGNGGGHPHAGREGIHRGAAPPLVANDPLATCRHRLILLRDADGRGQSWIGRAWRDGRERRGKNGRR